MSDIIKFTGSGTAVQRFEMDNGAWKPDDLHHNQTISLDPVTLDVVVTSTFETFKQVETFSQTPDTTDDVSFYVLKSNVFTDSAGAVITGNPGGDHGGGEHSGSQGGGHQGTYKFVVDGTAAQRFDFDDGQWRAEDLHRNQTISADPVTHDVTVTSSFATFTEVEIFTQTVDTTDDASLYTRKSDVYTALDGTVLPGNPRDNSHDQTVAGTTGKDKVDGGTGNDHLNGGDGNDKLNGAEGDDDLLGGTGNDTINGGTGLDVIAGDTGNDKLDGGADDDVVGGGDGTDTVNGGAGNDTLSGGAGNDKVGGGTGDDALNGDDGNDALTGGDGNDTISGGAGNDKVGGGTGDDDLNGGDGNDGLTGGDGNDTLLGGAGDDKLDGGKGTDHLLAGEDAGNDALGGGAGEDLVDYSAASTGMTINLAIGVAFGTTTTATSGTDKLSGIEDVLGSAFDDVIIGSKGDNKLDGGDGNDHLTGGKGADTLTGGAGNDVFVFTSVKDSDLNKTDVITDFHAGDVIDLSAIDAIKGVAGSAFTLVGAAPADGSAAGTVWFNAATHTLYASINDDAKAEIAIVLTGVDAITAADLVL
jgi:Ca2+-binding RTX toxin-like protein